MSTLTLLELNWVSRSCCYIRLIYPTILRISLDYLNFGPDSLFPRCPTYLHFKAYFAFFVCLRYNSVKFCIINATSIKEKMRHPKLLIISIQNDTTCKKETSLCCQLEWNANFIARYILTSCHKYNIGLFSHCKHHHRDT
jgi:hypothetical protein